MEGNRKTGTTSFDDLMKDERYRKAYESDKRFFEGFRRGYSCGWQDAIAELIDTAEANFDDGYDEGYNAGYIDGSGDLFVDDDIETEKPTDEESLLDFLDTLSLTEQRAALVHLSVKWAEMEANRNNECE